MSSAEFQREFQKRIQNNFAPLWVSAHYAPRGRVVVSAVWEKRSGGDVKLQAGLSRDEMTKAVNKWASAGYRLEFMTGSGMGGFERYTAVWEKAPGQQLAVRYGYPLKELLKRHTEFTTKKGYVIHSIVAVEDDGRLRYTAAWEKDDLADRKLYMNLSEGTFLQQIRKLPKQGYRLRQVTPGIAGRRMRIACIWDRTGGPEQEIGTRLTEAAVKKRNADMTGKGYVPAIVSGLSINRHDRYYIVWEKPDK